tara:strand:- start:21211 stop:22287 length:1077 start_codon:yes stop_codon:yes gene_type:complete
MPTDLRIQKLAKLLVNYSVFVKPNENVIISGNVKSQDLLVALYKEVILKGAHPILRVGLSGIAPFFYKYANKKQIEKFPDHFDYMAKNAQKYIGIDCSENTKALTNCNPVKITERERIVFPISDYIVNEKPKIYRVSSLFPCPAFAQDAEMDLIEYENFVYNSCLQDWDKLGKKMNKIAKKFKKGKEVWLKGNDVDLKFLINGKNLVVDDAKENMPGGEIFMAPIKDSLNGWIKFEYPAIRDGKEVSGVFLKFKNGKVIEAKADKNEKFLNAMLNVDENSGYVGEFGIGMNPKINKFTKNLLFDEKIGGTIHLALGMAYKENGGGNDSAIHWDIVKDMRKSKIILDGKVVQDNGKWMI